MWTVAEYDASVGWAMERELLNIQWHNSFWNFSYLDILCLDISCLDIWYFHVAEHLRRFLFDMLSALQINTFYQIPILVLPNISEKEVEFRPLAWSKKTIIEKNDYFIVILRNLFLWYEIRCLALTFRCNICWINLIEYPEQLISLLWLFVTSTLS